ncbi:MAG: PorT family protein [Bacteroidetes bacterium]|nr:PorT family protein [Bacteroidota bacterium]
MKKIIYIFFVVFLFCAQAFSQQRFRAGLKTGVSTSQVAGDTYSGFNKAGLDGGGFVTGKINEKWTVQFEIIYIQKGSRHNFNSEIGDYTYYFLQLDYIEVPLLFQFHQKKFTFELGPGYGYLLKEKEYNHVMDLTGYRPFNKNEICLNVGISFVLYKNFGINWRYSNSISSIRSHASGASTWNNPGQRNNVLAFCLTYMFGHAEE